MGFESMERMSIEEKEAVKVASMIERNGMAFYSRLADSVEDGGVKGMLERLRDDEKRHARVLEEIYCPDAGFGEEITEEEIDLEEFVSKNRDPAIFTRNIDIDKVIRALKGVREALLFALHTERFSVDYFEKMSEKAVTERGRQMYKRLADEESGHVELVEDLLRSL